MHITVLWPDRHGYVAAGAAALRRRGHEVTVWIPPDAAAKGASDSEFVSLDDSDRLDRELGHTDLVLSCGWHIAPFRVVLGRAKSAGVSTAVYFDTQWFASVRQRVRGLVARRVMPFLFDQAFVPGPRQAVAARHMGFPEGRVLRGGLTFDADPFAEVAPIESSGPRPHFVFVGRLVLEKGLDVLLAAYHSYRRQTAEPWGLIVAGDGPLKPMVSGPGVTALPHSTAKELAEAMGRSSCFVLPSRFEPFGVVLLEAAAAGLPIITTDRCGGTPVVVRDGENGIVVAADDVEDLTRAMLRMSSLDPSELSAKGERGRPLAAGLVPDRWADHVEELVRRAPSRRPVRWASVAAAVAGLGA